jgi:hypothetical protein
MYICITVFGFLILNRQKPINSLFIIKVMIKKMFTFVLFDFPHFWLWAYMYLIKVISEMRRAH